MTLPLGFANLPHRQSRPDGGAFKGGEDLSRRCEERLRRSNPCLSLWRDGWLRGACHRARIRATRWLAMTDERDSAILVRLAKRIWMMTPSREHQAPGTAVQSTIRSRPSDRNGRTARRAARCPSVSRHFLQARVRPQRAGRLLLPRRARVRTAWKISFSKMQLLS